MSQTTGFDVLGQAIRRSVLVLALPRLQELPWGEWKPVLEKLRTTEFESIERVFVIAGVVFVTYLLGLTPPQTTEISLFIWYFLQFVMAIPLLFIVIGPIYLRRARRGLDIELKRHTRSIPTSAKE